jgi:hypothetical protein
LASPSVPCEKVAIRSEASRIASAFEPVSEVSSPALSETRGSGA